MTWQDEAACVGLDPDFDPTDMWSPAIAARVATTGRDHCGRCPVIIECGRFADHDRLTDIWGGSFRHKPEGRYVARPLVDGAPKPVLTDRRSGVRNGWTT